MHRSKDHLAAWFGWSKGSSSNMLREDTDNGALNGRTIIEKIRSYTLDLGTLTQKLRLPGGKRRAFTTHKFIQRGGAYLAFDGLAFVQHRESERHSGNVVTYNFAPRERHRKLPRTTS
jgi:hypothetical protein